MDMRSALVDESFRVESAASLPNLGMQSYGGGLCAASMPFLS